MPEHLGIIVNGSLVKGMEMKLAQGRSVEDVRAGRFVVIQGEQFKFFSLITNVALAAVNPNILLNPPAEGDNLHRKVLAGTGVYGTVELRPMLVLEDSADDAEYNP